MQTRIHNKSWWRRMRDIATSPGRSAILVIDPRKLGAASQTRRVVLGGSRFMMLAPPSPSSTHADRRQ